ncbi:phospho-N-acetylmuramoyl-pentapeptide-transferase [bacterium]|nr:phospho-N-acetylmuramoyl-pentapeptide-transferase [candidate division CSSED10-310 bacterium]
MLYSLTTWLNANFDSLSWLRLFSYITFRAILAALTAFIMALFFGPPLIRWLKKCGSTDLAWGFGLVNVQSKSGTPTMGGILILATIISSTLLWCDLSNRFIQLLLSAAIWFGCIGALDDYLKLKHKSKAGLSEKKKILSQVGFGILLSLIYLHPDLSPVPMNIATKLFVPFFKNPIADMDYAYGLFIIFVVVAISNSVNLADGLDGLAIVPSFFVAGVFGAFSYVIGNTVLAQYLLFDYMPGSGEILIFCAAMIGSGIGFLWYNAYPAQIFMGDTGSLALGGLLGTIAILIKQEFLFVIAGGVFVAEAATVFLTKYIYVPRGKRFFFRAPLHHSLQYRGLAETKVVIRLWIVAALLALFAATALKIR